MSSASTSRWFPQPASSPPDPFGVAADIFDPPRHPYADDPVGYSRDILGFAPWSKQREMMESVRDHDRTVVRSCHGIGKTAGAAQVVLWFLATRADSKVITTAPTWTQVEKLLWREIRSQVRRAHGRQHALEIPTPLQAELTVSEQWFAIGLSTNEPERFQGHHANDLLLVVDEASGVNEGIFEAAEGFLTAEGAKVLLIGNPTKVGGQFYRAFSSERATWHQIHISVFDSPNYTGEHVPADVKRAMPRGTWAEEKAQQWGAESAIYQVRVEGKFPDTGDDTVIGLNLVEAAQARELEPGIPVVIACDVARFGDDETVIAVREDQRVRIRERYIGKPTTHTSGRVAEIAGEFPRDQVQIVIDDAGVGGGVTDQLRAAGWSVTAFGAGEQARDPKSFPNRRSELWFQGAAQMEDLDLDDDEQLAADLSSPRYSFDLKLRRVVEKKDETKKRLGRSPDRADAVLLTLVAPQRGVVGIPQGQIPGTRHGAGIGVPRSHRGRW